MVTSAARAPIVTSAVSVSDGVLLDHWLREYQATEVRSGLRTKVTNHRRRARRPVNFSHHSLTLPKRTDTVYGRSTKLMHVHFSHRANPSPSTHQDLSHSVTETPRSQKDHWNQSLPSCKLCRVP